METAVCHRRAEVAAADADVDHGADPLAGVTGPLAAAHPLGERAHPVEDLVHIGDDVAGVTVVVEHVDDRAARGAERCVQYGAVLGRIDLLAGEHRVAAPLDIGGRGDLDQTLQRVAGDALLGEVDAQIARRTGERRRSLRVVGEQLAQVRRGRVLEVGEQRGPRRGDGDVHVGDPIGRARGADSGSMLPVRRGTAWCRSA